MIFTLPYPPSANRYWRWDKRGFMRVSTQALVFKADVAKLARAALGAPPQPLAGPVRVTVSAYRPERRGDLDNALKVLLDALRGIAFADDSQVVELHATRAEDKANPRVVVQVEAAP